MVNASLNWASIVGIVLAVCGAGLYFLRSFKPALARDYDVFFAAIGLLCGGILFFQGWRLDPILQFGQFLLAGTTVFFAYESVRLRGIATDQARRSSYFDDEPAPARMPSGGGRGSWDDSSYDQFEESPSLRRRFSGRSNSDGDSSGDDFYRPRRTSRAAIPEQAASRRARTRTQDDSWKQDSDQPRRTSRFGLEEDQQQENIPSFGQRRNLREEQRRGTRPFANERTSGRRKNFDEDSNASSQVNGYKSARRPEVSKRESINNQAEDASFSTARRPNSSQPNERKNRPSVDQNSSTYSKSSYRRSSPRSSRPRDNSSRFDD